MNEISTSALNDLAFALHDSVNRFTKPLQPCGKTVRELMKQKGLGFLDAQEKAHKVPREIRTHEIERIEMFQQTWGSTSLGFGGMGGASMTTANVIIASYHGQACVYFGSRFAYIVPHSPELAEDILRHRMVDVKDAAKYSA
jgi:hypothetical protein